MTVLPHQGCLCLKAWMFKRWSSAPLARWHTTHGSACDTDGQTQEKEPQRSSGLIAGRPRWEPETGVRKQYFWSLLSMLVAQSEKPTEEHSSLLFQAM